MSRISALKLQLSKILASFSSLQTDKGVLNWPEEKEIEVGLEVYVEAEDGSYVPAEDGEYVAGEKTITVVSGKIESIKDPEKVDEEPEKEPEEPVEEVVKAEEVIDEPVVEEPTVDPLEAMRNRIEELFVAANSMIERIAAIEDRVAALEAGAVETSQSLEKMSKMSVAMSVEKGADAPVSTTGNSKLDERLKKMFPR